MLAIAQSTAKLVVFKAFLSSDHVTEATGKTVAVTISKNGGAFGNPAAGATNATEITSGWYKVSLGTGDTDTLGPLAIRGAVATIDDVGVWLEVVSASTGGMTNLDAAVSGRMATYTQPTGFLVATFPSGTVANTTNITAGTITTATNLTNAATSGDLTSTMKTSVTTAATAATPTAAAVTGAVGSVTGNVGGNVTGSVGSVTGLTASNLDVTVSSRLSTAGYTAPPSAATVAAAVLASAVETSMSVLQYLRLSGAVLLGKVSGAATVTNTFRNAVDDSKARVTATVDSDGNRTAITYDAS